MPTDRCSDAALACRLGTLAVDFADRALDLVADETKGALMADLESGVAALFVAIELLPTHPIIRVGYRAMPDGQAVPLVAFGADGPQASAASSALN